MNMANSQGPLFSHALIAALQVMTSACKSCMRISMKAAKAHALLTCTDHGIVARHVCLQVLLLHPRQHP
eukprot:CAMPEP_0180539622 /NCGR_PEP_ID=MMETSP1036_2-20121128/67003_1 /TAXON_ID=632150 /ORGANISM="Azadinium spinosum, Strain 3D9" /LENGTH=68 /DNA_ID=CAMNT_0022554407 /DNA_START=340 /DNA_END=546 /DNA_ORIENTATION=-